jgi:uncharacterized membrane protein YphA (DoxX/SURF4 family)
MALETCANWEAGNPFAEDREERPLVEVHMQAQMQKLAAPESLLQGMNPRPHWSLTKRIAFRLAFAYFVLYSIPFPAGSLPFTSVIVEKYDDLWHAIVPRVGKHLLHLSYDITVFTNGSGDTTYNYVQVLCFLMLAAVATVIWSVLDRRRPNYERLYQWLRLYVRFSLASAMIVYGSIKIMPLQMPAPSLTRLIEPYGDSSPMGLLWTFIGASKGFEICTGCAEMLGGVLLIIPRTTLLGGLVCLADTTMIFLFNMSYDVPVKLFSFHLLIMSVFLIAQDTGRLANLFLFSRRVEAVEPSPLFRRKWLNRSTLALQILFGLFLIGSSFYENYQQAKTRGAFAPKPPLYGIWMVEEFSVDGQARPPLLTDATRWQRVIVQSRTVLTIQPMSGSNQSFMLELNMEDRTLSLGKRNDSEWKALFSFQELDPGLMTLEGEMDGHKTYARLVRFDESTFLLTSRGFHWIQEYPFNR